MWTIGDHGLMNCFLSLLRRAVAQRCPSPPMKKLISVGGQHQGNGTRKEPGVLWSLREDVSYLLVVFFLSFARPPPLLPQESTVSLAVLGKAPTSVTSSVKLWTAARTQTWSRNSESLPQWRCCGAADVVTCSTDWMSCFVGLFFQSGPGSVLALPVKRWPVQEAQSVPGRHQPGAGQYVENTVEYQSTAFT